MAFTKTVKQVEYNVQITRTLGVPQWLLSDVRAKFVNEGKVAAIKELREGFMDHYGVHMGLGDAKDIVEDMAQEFGLKTPPRTPFNYDDNENGEPTLSDIFQAALRQ